MSNSGRNIQDDQTAANCTDSVIKESQLTEPFNNTSTSTLYGSVTRSCTTRHSGSTTKGSRCRPRVIRNRGALLVLLINAVVDSGQSSVINLILFLLLQNNANINSSVALTYFLYFVVGTGVPQLLYPLAGWIADARIGRYKVIRISIWCMWLGQCLLSVTFLPYLMLTGSSARNYLRYVQYSLYPVAFITINMGLAGFQANSIQFGIDQMLDSSGDEMSAFVHWYYWSNYFGGAALSIVLRPVLNDYSLGALMAAINVLFMGCSLLAWYKLKEWLIIEPQGENPFKTMYQVVRFASKHKSPIYRSALTYWDDRRPTRLDLAKSKYGGPFTTEEVEDVKSFLAITTILASLGLYIISDSTLASILTNLMKFQYFQGTAQYTDGDLAVSASTAALSFVSIPIYELLLYPIVQNCIGHLTILNRIGIGVAFGIVAQAPVLALYEIIYQKPPTDQSYCFLSNSTSALNASIPSPVIAIPFMFSTISEMLVFISGFEFICVQSPYRFRGMLIGMFYAIQGLCTTISSLLAIAVASERSWGYFCGTVYYTLTLAIAIVGLVLYLLAGKRYKMRERDEHIDHHMIVENYYSMSALNSNS